MDLCGYPDSGEQFVSVFCWCGRLVLRPYLLNSHAQGQLEDGSPPPWSLAQLFIDFLGST